MEAGFLCMFYLTLIDFSPLSLKMARNLYAHRAMYVVSKSRNAFLDFA
ncbi:hypothetical protein [Brevibacillus sp. IT-7CA2]